MPNIISPKETIWMWPQFKVKMVLPILLMILLGPNDVFGMFKDVTDKLIPAGTPVQRNYGVAVTNIGEGEDSMEWIVAGYSGPNIVLQMDTKSGVYRNVAQIGSKYESLMDPEGNAIGVSACDIDGDGKEEIYFLNTNNRYSGRKLVTDRLFTWRNNHYENLFEDEVNKNVLGMFSGRSVACIDRTGNGKYGILLATYAEMSNGKFELIEVDETRTRGKQIVLHSIAEQVGINFTTGGRGIVVGPVLGDDGFSDIYFVNEGNWRLQNRGDNAFFKNDGFGRFTNIASQLGIDDLEPGRGVTLADFNNDELIDIAYGNWNSRHKMFLQRKNHAGESTFYNVASPEFATPSYIRTVIAADFDNDGITEVLFNNIVYRGDASNKLFKVIPNGRDVNMAKIDIGDAREQDKYGTGAAIADMDDDGVLELLISHGESASQPLALYHVKRHESNNNNFIRIMPTTQYGAPARGCKVTLTLNDGTKLSRIIDGGSGYLCQMEPVAHFGLGHLFPRQVRIQWPDGHHHSIYLNSESMNKIHIVSFNGDVRSHNPRRSETVFLYHPESEEEEIKGAEDSSAKVSQKNRRQRPVLQRGGRQLYAKGIKSHNQRSRYTSSRRESLHSQHKYRSRTQPYRRRNPVPEDKRSQHDHSARINPHSLSSRHSTARGTHSQPRHTSGVKPQDSRRKQSRPEDTRSQPRRLANKKRRYNPGTRQNLNVGDTAGINSHSLLSRHSTVRGTHPQPRHLSGVKSQDSRTKHARPEDTRSQPRYLANKKRHYNPGTVQNLNVENTRSQQRYSINSNQRYNPGKRHQTANNNHSQRRHSTYANQRYNPGTRPLIINNNHSQRRHSANANQHYNPSTRHLSAKNSVSQRRHYANVNSYTSRTRHSSADDIRFPQKHITPAATEKYNPLLRHTNRGFTPPQPKHPSRIERYHSEKGQSTKKSSSGTIKKQSSRTEASSPQTDFSTRERSYRHSSSRTNYRYLNPHSRHLTPVNIRSHGRQSTIVDATRSRNSKGRYQSSQHKYQTRSEPYNPSRRQSRRKLPYLATKTTFGNPRLYPTTQHTPFDQNQRSLSRQITRPSRFSSRRGHEREKQIYSRRNYHPARYSSNKYSHYAPGHNVSVEGHSSEDRHSRTLVESYSGNSKKPWVAHISNQRKHSMSGLQPEVTERPSLYKTHNSRLHVRESHSNRKTRRRLEPLRALTHRQTSTSGRRHGARQKTRMSSYKMQKNSRHNTYFGRSAFHHASSHRKF